MGSSSLLSPLRRGAPLLLTVTLFGVTATAGTGDNVTLGETETVTAVSGYAGGCTNVGPSGDSQVENDIAWWETIDAPCKLTAYSHDLNTGERPDGVSSTLCGTAEGNKKRVRLDGDSNAIYKVQVCTTDTKNNRLKGIRLWGRTLDSKNPVKLTTQASPKESKHTNCAKWHTAVECPAGQVASKIRVHHTGHNTFTGIALVCREVVSK